jgi:glutamine synthetase
MSDRNSSSSISPPTGRLSFWTWAVTSTACPWTAQPTSAARRFSPFRTWGSGWSTATTRWPRQNGVYATFMPKPVFGQNGSGMHVHQSIFKGAKNCFFDGRDKFNLSKMAKHYIAGIMAHAPEITAICNQWVNSYKRLVPGYEAPVYVSWARRNRSAMVRVPMYKPGKEKATRMEYRSPDPACNPYLAFAVMLAAGMRGVEKAYPLPEPVEEDIFEMDEKARAKAGITSLPGSLYEALAAVQGSTLVRETLGDHVYDKFIENKKVEWDRFRIHVSQYEIDRYLPML